MNKILYEGKSKTIYAGESEDDCIIRFRDTATAFNGEKKEELSGKGVLNAAISNIIFTYLAKKGIRTHLIEVLDEDTILAKRAEIIMVEAIVRNIAAGSFSKKYGVPEGTPLENVTVEFSLKSDELGDPMINKSQATAIGIATKGELYEMTRTALKINILLTDFFREAGITLVDCKLEFGRYDGGIILCDEISPDSCRLWDSDTGAKLDKDVFRRDLGNVLDGYEDVLARLKAVTERKCVRNGR